MSSFTRTRSLNSAKELLSNESSESEFLLEDCTDHTAAAKEGIDFLFDSFPYAIHTFQYIKKSESAKLVTPVRTYTDKAAACKDALLYNQRGYDVFFMVNEGDGVIHDGKQTPRSQLSVQYLSKCFIDTDNCPIAKVEAYLNDIGLTPHIKICSSPNRYHLYFDFSPVPKTDASVFKWNTIQNMLHRLGDPSIKNPTQKLGMDKTMRDHSKILRVPGFSHIKKLALVAVSEISTVPPYTLDQIFELTDAQSYLDYNVQTYGTAEPSNVPDLADTSILPAGERFSALQSLSLHLANTESDRETAYSLFDNFVRNRLDNTDSVYYTDKLTPKSLALFSSAFDKVKAENLHIVQSFPLDDGSTPAPWHLPDSFYLSAPNGFGDIVKQVMDNSLYPCAALAFGTFLAGLSILKSKTHLTPKGSSPALYIINVAISGYGKNDPMTFLQNTLWHYGYGKLIGNEIRSDRGVYEHLAANDGLGFFLLDEIGPLLSSIQEESASTHLAYIAKAFLQLYSSGAMRGISFGKTAKANSKKGEPELVLDNPMAAICGYTVPSKFATLFNADSVNQGLFQRFIPIVPEILRVPENDNANKFAIITSPLFVHASIPVELDSEGNAVEAIQSLPRVSIAYTPDALKEFKRLSDHYRDLLISSANDAEKAPYSGLYSRLAEQIERVATVLSATVIDLPTLNYAAEFIESRHRAIMALADSTVLKTKGSENIQNEALILNTIALMARELETPVIFKTELYRRVRRSFATMKQFDTALADAAELRRIVMVPNYKRSMVKGARPGLGVMLGDLLD